MVTIHGVPMTLPYRLLSVASLLLALSSQAQEICNNAIDDDTDGLIDLNDTTDCSCSAVFGGEVNSLLPNPSFEDYDCIPTTYSELSCADTWEQATDATSDYFLNTGGGLWPPEIPLPVPDGIAVAGFITSVGYNEYVGGCLLSPMEAGVQQTLQMGVAGSSWDGFGGIGVFYGPVDITIFGSASCPAWPINTGSACSEGFGDWVELGSVNYTADATWQTVSITFTPTTDIQAVMIGGPCDVPPDLVNSGYYPYFWVDGLTLNASSLFGSTVTQTGGFCTEDVVLHGNPDPISTGYQWFQNGVALIGETDSLLHISALGLDSGLYQFQALLEDTACSISPFFVQPPVFPEPLIGVLPAAGCAPLDVSFTNQTDPVLTADQTWDFGVDNATSDEEDPDHTYTEPGLYDVTLTVTSPDGCVSDSTYVHLIEVFAIPLASFTADPVEGCTGMTVNFTNNSVGASEYAWTFGDPPASSDENPSHTYNVAGVYDVSLHVESAQGCEDDTLMTSLITVYDEPSVSFTSDTIAGCTPLTIQFTNTTPEDQVGTVEWDLGNGTVTDQDNPVGLYTEPGIYTVSLLVTHPQGCEAQVVQVDMITAYGHPVVTFTNQPDSGCYPLDVQFANTTDAAFTGTCHWDFGDGSSSDLCTPVHTYQDPGVYTVSLEVISPQNCDGDTTYADLITVFDHPVADFYFGPQPTDIFNTYITFIDSSSVDALQWSWEFGQDGVLGTSNEEHPALHFPDDRGLYPVQLVVTNIHTCTDTMVRFVEIDGYFAVYVPNSFTPDGDGVNDCFYPVIRDDNEKNYRLSIYDRWGTKVFDSSARDNVWAGTDMNREGEFVPQGVYVWKLQTASAVDGISHEYMGHVTLLR